VKIAPTHRARKALFQRAIRQGFLTVGEIERALPPGTLSATERWLLYYSLRASDVEIRDEDGQSVEGRSHLTPTRMAGPREAGEGGTPRSN
jgi:hypothetical protein